MLFLYLPTQHYFYNLVNPNQISLYGRPVNAKNDTLWEKAVHENPDPTCHVPVLAVGFDDLRTRVEAQNKKSDEHQQHLKEIKTRIESLTTQHTLSNSPRLLRAVVAQTQLSQRLLKFVQHLHLLIPSIRSSSIRPEEEQLRNVLEEIEDELKRGRMKGKLNELWALLGAVNAAKERARTGTGEWAVVDEDGLAHLTQVRIHSKFPPSSLSTTEFLTHFLFFLAPFEQCYLSDNHPYRFPSTSTVHSHSTPSTDSIRTTNRLDSPDQDTSKSAQGCRCHHGHKHK